MNGKSQKVGAYVAIGTVSPTTFQSGLSSLIPGQIVMDLGTKRMALGRPDGAGATVSLMTPLDPIKNDTDGVFFKRVGGFNYAVDPGGAGHHVRVRLQTTSPFGVTLSDGTPVIIGAGPDATGGITAAGGGIAIVPAFTAVTGSGGTIQVIPDDVSGQIDISISFVAAGTKSITLSYGVTSMTVQLLIA